MKDNFYKETKTIKVDLKTLDVEVLKGVDVNKEILGLKEYTLGSNDNFEEYISESLGEYSITVIYKETLKGKKELNNFIGKFKDYVVSKNDLLNCIVVYKDFVKGEYSFESISISKEDYNKNSNKIILVGDNYRYIGIGDKEDLIKEMELSLQNVSLLYKLTTYWEDFSYVGKNNVKIEKPYKIIKVDSETYDKKDEIVVEENFNKGKRELKITSYFTYITDTIISHKFDLHVEYVNKLIENYKEELNNLERRNKKVRYTDASNLYKLVMDKGNSRETTKRVALNTIQVLDIVTKYIDVEGIYTVSASNIIEIDYQGIYLEIKVGNKYLWYREDRYSDFNHISNIKNLDDILFSKI